MTVIGRIRPAVPSLIEALNDRDPRTLFLRPIFGHFVMVNVLPPATP